ncbi:MAG: acetyl-CoA carboxylase carboxyl transferase subunit beta, partial [Pyrinomonadaceae bacterium]|nr:acetyl-CoA carboxylase carboxyl transferase subunit beta [Pyrinomonadaceae bacterium]
MAWFRRSKPKLDEQPNEERTVKTEGVFTQCDECGKPLYRPELEQSMQVCIYCGYHFRFDSRLRLQTMFDGGEYERLDENIVSTDPLEFTDTKPYKQRLEQARKSSGLPEAIVCGRGKVGGHLTFIGAMDMNFIGGS